jgi:hypothetical protein
MLLEDYRDLVALAAMSGRTVLPQHWVDEMKDAESDARWRAALGMGQL